VGCRRPQCLHGYAGSVKKFLGALFLLAALFFPSAAHASVDDFSFDSFDGVYELSRDAEGRSVLTAQETLVARFPDFDQNRGIQRAIPETYLGTPLELEILSVTDETGADRPFESESDGAFLVLTIAVPEGDFVRGVQTYQIAYRAHNVILDDSASDFQEFFWDINGDGWQQTFGSVSADIRLDPSIAGVFTGQAACYAGDYGSTNPCDVLDAASTQVTASHGSLGGYQTLSVALQFEPGTFAQRDTSYWASGWWPFHAAATLLSFAVVALTVFRRFTVARSAPGRPTIIAEYGPPPGVSLYTASALLGKARAVFAASVVDLAVRGVIVVEEFDPPGFAKRAWAVRLITQPTEPDREFVAAIFGGTAKVGDRATVSKPSESLSQRVFALGKRASAGLVQLGLCRIPPNRFAFVALSLGAMFASFVTSIGMIADYRGDWIPAATLFSGFVLGVAGLILSANTPLTEAGAEVRDHIAGLDLYIRVAEADRLRVLQSPEGALRKPVDTSDTRTVLHLYELVLPWAILLGREKDWGQVLEVAYAGDSPTWYAASVPFAAGSFSSSLSSFSTATSAGAASSSGGSSGGGSAGGGGGGGGGGGV
jgi:uncharacterized membrane protein YgcG